MSEGSSNSRTPPNVAVESAVPTLRVMRLQSPELHVPATGSLDHQSLLHSSLCLPDSLAVYVGETFTAYLGVLNTSKHVPIRRLSVSAQLQTPTNRRQLPSKLEQGNSSGGIDVQPSEGVDAIVSHAIDEPGQHILRVEVGYMTSEGGSKTFRKFYRFQVSSPLSIHATVMRSGDSRCFVSVAVECMKGENSPGQIVVSSSDFVPADGLTATRLGTGAPTKIESAEKSAVDLLDESGFLHPGSIFRYLFQVDATSQDARLRGLASGDFLGKASVTWRQAMGETGHVSSSSIVCPPALTGPPTPSFVVHRSGLSVDVASAAATRGRPDRQAVVNQFPVTVEPIDPPSRMQLNVPLQVQFLLVNHSEQPLTLQLQLRLGQMNGLAVCGPSFQSVGTVPGSGGSTVVPVSLVALSAGLLRVQGCVVVDLASGREIVQPPLFHAFVDAVSNPQ